MPALHQSGRVLFLLAILQALLLSSCGQGIGEKEAESIAKDFVQERVKFFVRNESEKIEMAKYRFENVSSEAVSGGYSVVLHVSAEAGNETKSADVRVTLDKSGEIRNLEKLNTK